MSEPMVVGGQSDNLGVFQWQLPESVQQIVDRMPAAHQQMLNERLRQQVGGYLSLITAAMQYYGPNNVLERMLNALSEGVVAGAKQMHVLEEKAKAIPKTVIIQLNNS